MSSAARMRVATARIHIVLFGHLTNPISTSSNHAITFLTRSQKHAAAVFKACIALLEIATYFFRYVTNLTRHSCYRSLEIGYREMS